MTSVGRRLPFLVGCQNRTRSGRRRARLFAEHGYAISSDGRYIARAGTTEASLSDDSFGSGLFVVDATTGAAVAGAPASTATPLAFSPDGSRV